MKKLILFFSCTIALAAHAQDTIRKWDLRSCVDYAMKNNISVKLADVQARIAALQLKQAKFNQYPNANFNAGFGGQFGRSIDRTTNVYTNVQSIYQNFQLTSNMELYNFGRLKNLVAYNKFNADAAMVDVEKASSDAALSVCTYYLQILATNEQIKVNEVQIQQTKSQLDITKKQVEAGSLPELNLVELEAQLATDSTNLITSQTTYEQNILSLKAVMNIDAGQPFAVDTPSIDKIPVLTLLDLQPETVYGLALQKQPQQRANELRIQGQQKNIRAAKSLLYPNLGVGVNLATNFYNPFKKVTGYSLDGYVPSPSFVTVGGTNYFLQDPNIKVLQAQRSFGELWDGWGTQINNNFGQTVGFSLSIPIFNNGQYRIAYEQSKLNLRTQQVQKERDNMQLKNDIYTAYTNAIAAMQKYYAGKKQVESAQKAYDFSRKRYDIGMLGTLDLLINQNKLLQAKIQQVSNQYEYVFRMKLLEFYRGEGLQL